MDAQALFEACRSAVLSVTTSDGHGTGFFIDPRGLAVTNLHVLDIDTEVILETHAGEKLRGTLVESVRNLDLAFLLASTSSDVHSLGLAESHELRVGAPVIVIGHPGGLKDSVSQGIVSGLDRLLGGTSYFQIDAAINPGNSGGPVIGANGHVVGMATRGMSGRDGLGFAIPAFTIRQYAEDVIHRFSSLSSAKYCVVCGRSRSPSMKYCDHCGASLARSASEIEGMLGAGGSQWRCPICRFESSELRPQYCPRCGASVANGRTGGANEAVD